MAKKKSSKSAVTEPKLEMQKVVLTEDEITVECRRVVDLLFEIETLKREKAAFVSDIAGKIKGLESQVAEASDRVSKGYYFEHIERKDPLFERHEQSVNPDTVEVAE